MNALVTAIVYFGSFLALGALARLAVRRRMARKDLDLSSLRAQIGPSRRPRRLFLLGFWRNENPDC